MNGTGLNNFDDNGGKDYVGRVLLQPFGKRRILTVGGNFRKGTSAPKADGATADDSHMRWGIEGDLRVSNFTVQGEYIYGENVGSYTTGGGCGGPGEVHEGSINRQGWYVTAMYMTNWRFQPVLKYEYYDSNIDESDQFSYVTTLGFNYFFNDWTRLQVNYMMVNSNQVLDSQLGDNLLDKLLMIQFQAMF